MDLRDLPSIEIKISQQRPMCEFLDEWCAEQLLRGARIVGQMAWEYGRSIIDAPDTDTQALVMQTAHAAGVDLAPLALLARRVDVFRAARDAQIRHLQATSGPS